MQEFGYLRNFQRVVKNILTGDLWDFKGILRTPNEIYIQWKSFDKFKLAGFLRKCFEKEFLKYQIPSRLAT